MQAALTLFFGLLTVHNLPNKYNMMALEAPVILALIQNFKPI
jgi:hypothetical protein